ncbi:uncharacterized protein LOC143471312 isoform X2 [Clavelina lepadiformis]|uniref:uncharacterized protein LOC143471312 isoform X2 n=1 Tax=Clavelina lepadiformis TaxID=159417 RepID=UPI0040418813
MALRVLPYLALTLTLSLPDCLGDGPSNHTGNICSKKSLPVNFPGGNIPEQNTFMIFGASGNFSEDDALTERTLCLSAVSTRDPLLAECNSTKTSQKWYQYRHLLFNLRYGHTMTSNGFYEGADVILSSLQNQTWLCSHTTASVTSLLTKRNATSFYLGGSRNALELSNLPDMTWGIASGEGRISGELNLLCAYRDLFCGPPLPGIRSFIVTSEYDLSLYLHLSSSLVDEIIREVRACYAPGDKLLIGCPLGHVQIGTNDRRYKVVTCFGGGKWSDPVPMHCEKVTCGEPEVFPNAVYRGNHFTYSDTIRYKCVGEYVGDDVTHICDPRGKWFGEAPQCNYYCEFNLTAPSGLIKSPNYPNPYPHDVDCRWLIRAREGFRVALWIRDFFIEPGSIFSSRCQFEVLFIQDVHKESSYVDKFCGSLHPGQWTSSGNYVIVGFHSDHSYSGKGFKIEYTTWNPEMSDYPVEPARNGTYPDEEDKSNVNTYTEYGSYFMEALYIILLCVAILLIFVIVTAHVINNIKSKIHPSDEEDVYGPDETTPKVAQQGMTTLFDPEMTEVGGEADRDNASTASSELSDDVIPKIIDNGEHSDDVAIASSKTDFKEMSDGATNDVNEPEDSSYEIDEYQNTIKGESPFQTERQIQISMSGKSPSEAVIDQSSLEQ